MWTGEGDHSGELGIGSLELGDNDIGDWLNLTRLCANVLNLGGDLGTCVH